MRIRTSGTTGAGLQAEHGNALKPSAGALQARQGQPLLRRTKTVLSSCRRVQVAASYSTVPALPIFPGTFHPLVCCRPTAVLCSRCAIHLK